MTPAAPAVDAIVLAGGRASRLGGADKGALVLGGDTLLARAIDAAADARALVVVGPPGVAPEDMLSVREDPPFAGPVAAIAAGLEALPSPPAERVLVLACDMPYAAEAVPSLLASASGDGTWAVDTDGRVQPLLAVYRRAALAAALAGLDSMVDVSMRRLTAGLSMTAVPVVRAATDADTWEDVERLRKELS
ncbi:molybdenum cofactor guanylyltransferase [Demequina sp. NBRC 110057]|uniref:molybdenum cofactor guanylyltransferase n=1 Tax=Demequina sp. NBRC 110057 TaxID=1570346 RepID=UPI001177A416|nr:NTP transferase domain-containing protein [Demequina sp. NBRC 110057]